MTQMITVNHAKTQGTDSHRRTQRLRKKKKAYAAHPHIKPSRRICRAIEIPRPTPPLPGSRSPPPDSRPRPDAIPAAIPPDARPPPSDAIPPPQDAVTPPQDAVTPPSLGRRSTPVAARPQVVAGRRQAAGRRRPPLYLGEPAALPWPPPPVPHAAALPGGACRTALADAPLIYACSLRASSTSWASSCSSYVIRRRVAMRRRRALQS
jgi:hypothetical protein